MSNNLVAKKCLKCGKSKRFKGDICPMCMGTDCKQFMEGICGSGEKCSRCKDINCKYHIGGLCGNTDSKDTNCADPEKCKLKKPRREERPEPDSDKVLKAVYGDGGSDIDPRAEPEPEIEPEPEDEEESDEKPEAEEKPKKPRVKRGENPVYKTQVTIMKDGSIKFDNPTGVGFQVAKGFTMVRKHSDIDGLRIRYRRKFTRPVKNAIGEVTGHLDVWGRWYPYPRKCIVKG